MFSLILHLIWFFFGLFLQSIGKQCMFIPQVFVLAYSGILDIVELSYIEIWTLEFWSQEQVQHLF